MFGLIAIWKLDGISVSIDVEKLAHTKGINFLITKFNLVHRFHVSQ